MPNPGDAAAAGIRADTELQPFRYLIQAASALGRPITINGRTYDFTGLGQADTAGQISDQMAATLLQLQQEKSPEIIEQRLSELRAADPQGYAARQQLFDRIMADARANPDRPVATELQQRISAELSKGVGFSDAREEEQVREGIRGGQTRRGIFLGGAPSAEEAAGVTGAGEARRTERQQRALALLESGATPEETAYRRMQQSLTNLGAFQRGETPAAQFQQVSGARNGPVDLTGGAPNTNTFNPNAGGQGVNTAMSFWNTQNNYANNQANPWLAGLSIASTATGSLAGQGAFRPGGFLGPQPTQINTVPPRY